MISRTDNPKIVATNVMRSEHCNSGAGYVTNQLSQSIKSCELALSSASARAWGDKIKNAQKTHYTAIRFVNRFNITGHEAHRINQRITHLQTLLDELE